MKNPGFDVEPKYAPNGRSIVFVRLRTASSGDQEAAAFLVPARGGGARQITSWGALEHPTWSPDSRWIIFNTPDGTIEAIRPDGGRRHVVRPATEGAGGHKPWFSPEGSRILFMCENQGLLAEPPADYDEDICVMDADGSNVVNLTTRRERWRTGRAGAGTERRRRRRRLGHSTTWWTIKRVARTLVPGTANASQAR